MRFFLIISLFFYGQQTHLFAQKPVIDSLTYSQWPSLEGPTICKDGKYLFYMVQNEPIGRETLVLEATNGRWKKEFKGSELKKGYLALSNKYFFYLDNNNRLGMLTLGTNCIKYISEVSGFRLQETDNGECLFYSSIGTSKKIVIKNLESNRERYFVDVSNWSFDKNVLVLLKPIQGYDKRRSINLADINTGKVFEIWEGDKPEGLILDINHRQLAFKASDSVWYYKMGLNKAICIVDDRSTNEFGKLSLGNLDSFSKDGTHLFTSLIEKRNSSPLKAGVRVWSYMDVQLQSEQKMESSEKRYLAVINVLDHKIIRLQNQIDEEFQFPRSNGILDTLALIKKNHYGESWSIAHKSTSSLVSLNTGKRKKLDFLEDIGVDISPSGKYLIYFDTRKQNYFSYEIATGTIRNLTNGIEISWVSIDHDDNVGALNGSRGIVAWLKNDESLLIYDRYDIWKFDPLNKKKPVNLTNGYGKKYQIVFNIAFDVKAEDEIGNSSRLYLTAFNTENKSNGFFRKQLDKIGDPELLTMGPYSYKTNSPYIPDDYLDFNPIKAKNAEMYIVKRRNPIDAPNYFSTKDFKIFTRLSNYQPQKKYNWYTTELHTWTSLNGRGLQGILYKPEDFDRSKKYPIIFHYYERKSDGLNSYIQPELLGGGMNIDIPSYVSKGYLVFCPDIYYKVGDPMQGTYNAVISAANYVSTLPFVDAKRMGIQGGSFGGFQTNYLITHTNLFAAAVSSSGVADWISAYGSLMGGENSQQSYYETGQPRIGASLWEAPEAYIKSSPIFQVDKVTTPLLMMHTINDGICPYSNALEFFTGLRRMGKKAWMLVYSDGSHSVSGKEADDFSIRMMQFFDYYLKDKATPNWMLDGGRELDANLQLDNSGRTPGPGLLTPTEQKKADNLMTRKPITITLK